MCDAKAGSQAGTWVKLKVCGDGGSVERAELSDVRIWCKYAMHSYLVDWGCGIWYLIIAIPPVRRFRVSSPVVLRVAARLVSANGGRVALGVWVSSCPRPRDCTKGCNSSVTVVMQNALITRAMRVPTRLSQRLHGFPCKLCSNPACSARH